MYSVGSIKKRRILLSLSSLVLSCSDLSLLALFCSRQENEHNMIERKENLAHTHSDYHRLGVLFLAFLGEGGFYVPVPFPMYVYVYVHVWNRDELR